MGTDSPSVIDDPADLEPLMDDEASFASSAMCVSIGTGVSVPGFSGTGFSGTDSQELEQGRQATGVSKQVNSMQSDPDIPLNGVDRVTSPGINSFSGDASH